MKQPIVSSSDWHSPTLDQWAVLFCLVIIAAAIAGAVPHASGLLHKLFLVALDLLAGGYVVVSLITGGGK